MQVIDYQIRVEGRGDVLYLIPISDIHIGTKNCDEEKLKETVDWIRRTPNAYWLGMGDYCDFINYTDKRFDPSTLTPHSLANLDNLHIAQANLIAKIFEPIHSRCIGLLEGNHDDTIRQRYQTNIVDFLAVKLNTKNLSYVSMIRLNIKRNGLANGGKNIVIYATHGFGGGMSEGAPINRLISQSSKFIADIYLMGHVHKKIAIDRDMLYLTQSGDTRLQEKKQLFGITGTFLKTYENGSRNYAERSGYAPTPTGVLKIRIEPFKHTRERGTQKMIDLPVHIHVSA